MGYATARYGHVMFPENVYEPALECAELLLEGVGKGLSFKPCPCLICHFLGKLASWSYEPNQCSYH